MNELFGSYKARLEASLISILQTTPMPAPRIQEAMRYVLLSGGKRLRPLLVYLCGNALEIELDCLDVLAASIEMIHCYSLVHDDLPAMDNDDFRRGKPSCHKAFGEATAILVGDALQALSLESLLRKLPAFLDPKAIIDIGLELVTAAGASGMVSGQGLDLAMLTKPGLSEAELRSIHHLKTGRLILASINMVLCAKPMTPAIEKVGAALQTYASDLGLVFQMQDDYLDAYAPLESLGKNRASDSANQKTTFASWYDQRGLQALIHDHYTMAKKALRPLGARAEDLLQLTNYLQQRSVDQLDTNRFSISKIQAV